MKLRTLKINARGTLLGQRFLRLALKHMVENDYDEFYMTIYPKHSALIQLVERFGFRLIGRNENGEGYYMKEKNSKGNIYLDYPFVNTKAKNYLLSIYPKYHTSLFPESMLHREKHQVQDDSMTNGVEKIYLSGNAKSLDLNEGDLLLIYRTGDSTKPAEYSSVATSVCTVVEVKHMDSFAKLDDFLDYCRNSVFKNQELIEFYKKRNYPYVIKMLYNIALKSRVIRKELCDKLGLERDLRIVLNELDSRFIENTIELSQTSLNYLF